MSKYNPPFDITNKILTLVSDIAELAGSIKESAIFAKLRARETKYRILSAFPEERLLFQNI